MIHFDVKKKKISIFLCLLSILLIVFILSYRNANTRLPDSVKEYYEPGDVVEDNGLEICASNLYYGNIKDIVNEKGLPKDISGKKDALVLILSITNKSEKEVKLLADFIPNVAMVGYPIGYYNQGYIYALDESEDLNMQSGETRKVAITFAVSNGLVRQERRNHEKNQSTDKKGCRNRFPGCGTDKDTAADEI